jgi:hypothetical protein
MPDQENYGRFTLSAWNIIKSVRLSEEEQDMLRLMIETKTETITLEEVQSMLYTVVHQKNVLRS